MEVAGIILLVAGVLLIGIDVFFEKHMAWRDSKYDQLLDVLGLQREARKGYRHARRAAVQRASEDEARAWDAVRELLNAIVRLCVTSPRHPEDPLKGGFPDSGFFWIKVYAYDSDEKLLLPVAVSDESPVGAMRYPLKLGQGGAGGHLADVQSRPGSDRERPEFLDLDQIKFDLEKKQEDYIDACGLQSMLTAAVFARTRDGDSDTAFPKTQPERIVGVLCFCSKLPQDETSLNDPSKRLACQVAAELLGLLFAQSETHPIQARELDSEKPDMDETGEALSWRSEAEA